MLIQDTYELKFKTYKRIMPQAQIIIHNTEQYHMLAIALWLSESIALIYVSGITFLKTKIIYLIVALFLAPPPPPPLFFNA
jgi:hypothetical protein